VKKLALLIWLPLLFIPGRVAGDTYDTHALIRIELPGKEDWEFVVASRIDVVDAGKDWVKALATPQELETLTRRRFRFEILYAEMEKNRRLWREAEGGKAPVAYYTASAFDTVSPPAGSLMEHLLALHNAHPDITRLFDIGDSVSGRYDIIAIEVTDNPGTEENEPEIRLYGNIHGDEKSGLMIVCDVLDWILDTYATDPAARKLVNEAELWFIPMGNPDGNASNNRYNANGVDLNRNFWGPVGNADGPFPFSEPETQAVRDLTEVMGNRFVTSISFHGGAVCFNSVYNYTSAATPDEPIFFSARTGGPQGAAVPAAFGLADAYRQGCTTSGFWYTNGADWYVIRGDTNDWSYSRWGDLDTTVEVTSSGTPPPSSIPTFCAEHRQAVINYMLKTFQGVAGLMRDAETGTPLDGQVVATATSSASIPVPHEYKEVYTDPRVGDFHRVLEPAVYTVECRAPGFRSVVIPGVVVNADETTVVNCTLSGVDLAYDSSTTEDVCPGTGSGGDGILDPGEDIILQVALANRGSRPATGVTATLTTSTPGVTVTRGDAAFPDAAGGSTVTSDPPHFSFHIDEAVPCGTVIELGLTIRSNAGTFPQPLTETVGHVILSSGTRWSEDFDGVAAPDLLPGWAVAAVSGGTGEWATGTGTVHPAGGGTHSGANLVYFNSWTAQRGDSTRLFRTAGVSLADVTGAFLNFWMYHDDRLSFRNDRIRIQVSTDGGGTWENVGSPVDRVSATVGWAQHSVDLSAYLGAPDLRIALLGESAHGNDCHLDDIELRYDAVGSCETTPCIGSEPVPGEVSGPSSPRPLKLARNPAQCPTGVCLYFEKEASAEGYNLYEGTLGAWFSHRGAPGDVCGAAAEDQGDGWMRYPLDPSAGDHYYLVTAFRGAVEGTAGSAPGDSQCSCPP
jgi:hypothetical protein